MRKVEDSELEGHPEESDLLLEKRLSDEVNKSQMRVVDAMSLS